MVFGNGSGLDALPIRYAEDSVARTLRVRADGCLRERRLERVFPQSAQYCVCGLCVCIPVGEKKCELFCYLGYEPEVGGIGRPTPRHRIAALRSGVDVPVGGGVAGVAGDHDRH